MKERFTETIKVRTGKTLKNNLVFLAGQKQKDYADIVRDAVTEYVNRHFASQYAQAQQFSQNQPAHA